MRTNLSFTQPSNELSSALAETIASVEVQCPMCANRGPMRAFGAGHSDLACVCPGCRPGLMDAPLLPEGHTLLRELGRGGMGAVYLTKFQDEERAVKVLLPTVATSRERRELFLQEASIQKQLRHSSIVSLYELYQIAPGVFCIVMEYVPGINAAELLSRGPIAPANASRVMIQALDGLSYIHQSGFLHRDLKDPNILLSEDLSQSKISDFGLAVPYALLGKNLDAEHAHNPSGTLPYMAPEAFQKHQPSPLIDIYAMGATLYRLLSGEYPHDFSVGKSKLAVAALDPIVPLQTRRPELPPYLVEVVHRALARDPNERFQSAQEMRDALTPEP
jgi:serine/threonine protein kinase